MTRIAPLVLAFILPGLAAASVSAPAKPPVFVEKGVFPYPEEDDEHDSPRARDEDDHDNGRVCPSGYGAWKSRETLTLVKAPGSRQVVGEIRQDMPARALTGEVHSRAIPLEVVVPQSGFKRGDKVWYLAPTFGEGRRYLWAKGKRFPLPKAAIVDAASGKPPCREAAQGCWANTLARPSFDWWVEFALGGKRRGWALLDKPFQQVNMESESCEDE